MSSRNAIWLSSTNSISSPASLKSVWAASSVIAREPVIAVARHGGGRDRQQRAADAIAAGVHLAVWHHLIDRVERRHDAGGAIAIERKVAIGGGRIAPGHHEHGETALDQIAHQRIVRAQVEHVIFHDPCRHDQHRLGDTSLVVGLY